MAKYSSGYHRGSLYVWEHDNPEPPSSAKKIMSIENNDSKVAAFVVRALNARHKYESTYKKPSE